MDYVLKHNRGLCQLARTNSQVDSTVQVDVAEDEIDAEELCACQLPAEYPEFAQDPGDDFGSARGGRAFGMCVKGRELPAQRGTFDEWETLAAQLASADPLPIRHGEAVRWQGDASPSFAVPSSPEQFVSGVSGASQKSTKRTGGVHRQSAYPPEFWMNFIRQLSMFAKVR